MFSCGGDRVLNKLEEYGRWIVPPTTVCLGKLLMYSSYGYDLIGIHFKGTPKLNF